MNDRRVMVAMSGGVDSSVSALLLKEQGYDLLGVSMILYDPLPTGGRSPFDAAADAKKVARLLGIPFEVLDLRREFRERIISYFVDEYHSGRTPNPCVRCNRAIKFGLLLDHAQKAGARFLATGHYARTVTDPDGTVWLTTGDDPAKDQSYFLFTLSQSTLRKVLFPVGGLEKGEVRRIAARNFLPVAHKSESQEVCFIPDDDYVRFLEGEGLTLPPGEIVLSDGRVVGRHGGIHRYTVGQRRGLRVALGERVHVLRIDPSSNRIVVGRREETGSRRLEAVDATWNVPPDGTFRASCRIRYRHHPAPCTVTLLDESRFHVEFDEPQYAVTPGQAAVVYRGDRVLGGGWIA